MGLTKGLLGCILLAHRTEPKQEATMSIPETNHPLNVGSSVSKCTGCNAVFSSEKAFDMHRKGEGEHRYCADPRDVGLELKERKAGTLWGRKGSWPERA